MRPLLWILLACLWLLLGPTTALAQDSDGRLSGHRERPGIDSPVPFSGPVTPRQVGAIKGGVAVEVVGIEP